MGTKITDSNTGATIYNIDEKTDNREMWEQELLSILLNYPSMVLQINFKPEYFEDPFNAKLFNYVLNHRDKEFQDFNFEEMARELGNIDARLALEICAVIRTNEVHDSSRYAFLKFYANKILQEYVKGQIDKATLDFSKSKIDNKEFFEIMDGLKNLTVEPQTDNLTKQMIDDYIANDQVGLFIKGFPTLSRKLTIAKEDVITVAATSGFGKSAFMLNIYNALAQGGKCKCQYFNLEISEQTIVKRMISIISNKEMTQLNARALDQEWYKDARDKFYNSGSTIKSGSITIEELEVMALNNLDKDKTNVLFVDHIGLLGVSNDKHIKTEYDRVTYCMKELRALALDNHLIIFIASQFDRASVKSGKLDMFSLKSSGEIENSSTHVLIMKHSDKEDDYEYIENISINVDKNRNGTVGKLDCYTFNKLKQTFHENDEKDVRT